MRHWGFNLPNVRGYKNKFFLYNIFMKKCTSGIRSQKILAHLASTAVEVHFLWTFKVILFPVFSQQLSKKKKLLLPLTKLFYSFYTSFILLLWINLEMKSNTVTEIYLVSLFLALVFSSKNKASISNQSASFSHNRYGRQVPWEQHSFLVPDNSVDMG